MTVELHNDFRFYEHKAGATSPINNIGREKMTVELHNDYNDFRFYEHKAGAANPINNIDFLSLTAKSNKQFSPYRNNTGSSLNNDAQYQERTFENVDPKDFLLKNMVAYAGVQTKESGNNEGESAFSASSEVGQTNQMAA